MHMYMPHAAIFAVTEAFVSTSRESYMKDLEQSRFRAVVAMLLPSACKYIQKTYLKAL